MSTPKTTQSSRPWKATARTVFQMFVGFTVMLPALIGATNLNEATPWVGGALAFSAAVTRIMALPQVEEFLARFIPFLAADPDVSDYRLGLLDE